MGEPEGYADRIDPTYLPSLFDLMQADPRQPVRPDEVAQIVAASVIRVMMRRPEQQVGTVVLELRNLIERELRAAIKGVECWTAEQRSAA